MSGPDVYPRDTGVTVSGIHIYPVKSLRGYAVQDANVEARGFRGDRRFMVVTPAGDFVSQRECHAMAPVTARIRGDDLVLSAADHGMISIPVAPGTDRKPEPVSIWDSQVMATPVGRAANHWLSRVLDRDVRLVHMPESTHRSVDSEYDTGGDIVSFADGYPYLGIGDASVDDLNGRMSSPLPMERFRPNLTFSGSHPFAEDDWGLFRVGSAVFRNVKLCARCVVTTIDPASGTAGHEPLATLATYRKRDGMVFMGVNLVPVGDGIVRVGDPVTLLEPRTRG